MSQTKFTKGPWVIHVHPEVNSIIAIDFGDNEESSFSGSPATLYSQDNKANANLIAAAPDMYAMLKNVFDNYETDTHLDNQITVLLKKARGES